MKLTKETLEQIIKEELEAVLDEGEICAAGKNYFDGKTIGGQVVKRGKDGKFNNWSARAVQIASKYCKDPNYGKGRGKDAKNEEVTPEEESELKDIKGQLNKASKMHKGQADRIDKIVKEEEGGLKKWEKENWTHSDGTPCGGGKKDGSQSRCKPAAKWKTMSKGEKAADNAKKKAGTKAGKQYVSATKKGKVTKSYTKQESLNKIIDETIEEVLSEMGFEEKEITDPCEMAKDPTRRPMGMSKAEAEKLCKEKEIEEAKRRSLASHLKVSALQNV